MSHNYLLDLNRYIESRIASLNAASQTAAPSSEDRRRAEGRLDALEAFQALLCREYYPKLPQRLYRRLSTRACRVPAPQTGGGPSTCGGI